MQNNLINNKKLHKIKYGSISHYKLHSFCIRLYYVAIETVTHIKHGMHNKVTFVLSSDKIVIRLLVDLAIDLKQFRKLEIY